MRFPLRLAVAITLLPVGAPLLAQEAPRWKFSSGDELRYNVVQATAVDTDAGPAGTYATQVRQVLDVVWRIDAVDDAGVATGTQSITRIRLQINLPSGLELNYDSQSEGPPTGIAAMLTPMFETLLDNRVPIRISPTGEVLECELPKEMAERLARIPATRAMSDLVTTAGVRQIAEQIALPLPAAGEPPVRLIRVENRILGTLSGELKWTPSEASGENVARFTPSASLSIEAAPEVSWDDSTQPQPIASPEIREQSIAGTAEFDTAAGRLEAATVGLDLTITGTLMDNPVSCDVKQTVEVKRE